MSSVVILPIRLYYVTALSTGLSFALLVFTASFYGTYQYEYEWTKFICRVSLTYYTLCLIVSSRNRPVPFSAKWTTGFAIAIMFLFTILIYDSIPTAIGQTINQIRGYPVQYGPLWKLIVVGSLELAQVGACGLILQRCLESRTWEAPIQLSDDDIVSIEEAREEVPSSSDNAELAPATIVDTSA